jgi:hypothetical protein
MAEFVDVVVTWGPGDAPDIVVRDEHGERVALKTQLPGWDRNGDGVWERRVRIQHNEVEDL